MTGPESARSQDDAAELISGLPVPLRHCRYTVGLYSAERRTILVLHDDSVDSATLEDVIVNAGRALKDLHGAADANPERDARYRRATTRILLMPVGMTVYGSVAFLLSLLVAALLFLFLNRTGTGRAIRAASENWEAATYMGINIDRTNRIAFGVGVALTAVGGAALVTFQSITPFVGLRFVVVMFAAVVLGGLGSVSGAFVGGVLIGIIQSVSQVWTSAAVKNVWVFALFLLILYVRPNGLFGKVQRAI